MTKLKFLALCLRHSQFMCLVIAVILDPVRRKVHIKLDINPFLIQNDDTNKAKKLEVSEFDTSSEMVAGAGFEPTTFGL